MVNTISIFDFTVGNAGCKGVVSYGALGHVPPRLPFIFLVASEPHKL